MSFLKRMLKRPFTSTELHEMAAHNLAKPPLPDSMYEAAATLVGKKGVSLLDHWRATFSFQLDEIVGDKTWQGQRAKLLKIVLRGGSVCLNSFGLFVKWISASIMPPPSLVPAR